MIPAFATIGSCYTVPFPLTAHPLRSIQRLLDSIFFFAVEQIGCVNFYMKQRKSPHPYEESPKIVWCGLHLFDQECCIRFHLILMMSSCLCVSRTLLKTLQEHWLGLETCTPSLCLHPKKSIRMLSSRMLAGLGVCMGPFAVKCLEGYIRGRKV